MVQPTHKNLLVVIGEPPCTKHRRCKHYDRCAKQRQACKAFHLWVIRAKPYYWRRFTKEELYTPSDTLYAFIFGGDDYNEEAPL